MSERTPDAEYRRDRQRTEEQRGHPEETGPGTGTGMGTETGSGWPPKGDRFGEDAGEHEDAPEQTHAGGKQQD